LLIRPSSKARTPRRAQILSGYATTPAINLERTRFKLGSLSWWRWPQLQYRHQQAPIGEITALDWKANSLHIVCRTDQLAPDTNIPLHALEGFITGSITLAPEALALIAKDVLEGYAEYDATIDRLRKTFRSEPIPLGEPRAPFDPATADRGWNGMSYPDRIAAPQPVAKSATPSAGGRMPVLPGWSDDAAPR
jgi:hypothetical protein